MKTFKGTKGEWFISKTDELELETIIQTKNFRIAEVKHYGSQIDIILKEPSKKEGKANAKLIAAAPDLLEALQDAKKEIEDLRQMIGHTNPYNDELDAKIEKAINKAL